MSPMSINRYLQLSATIAFTILAAWLITSAWLLERASSDETIEYYLHYDAQVLTEFYPFGSKITEFDAKVKEYYWQQQQLPEALKTALETPIQPNVMQVIKLANTTAYLYPYLSDKLPQPFFVVHYFANNDHSLWYQALKFKLLIAAVLLVISLLGFGYFIIAHIKRNFSLFSQTLIRLASSSQSKQVSATNAEFTFIELANAFSQLKQSLLQQFKAIEQEQNMLACLSHELRTPMAISQAGLSVLAKQKLPEKAQWALAKIQQAEQQLAQLTDTFLQLWRQQPSKTQAIELKQLIEDSCEQFSDLNINKSLTSVRLMAEPKLVAILLRNLLENANQYAEPKQLTIELSEQQLCLINPVADNAENSNNIDYGYGLGLFIAEKICQQLHWQLVITKDHNSFRCLINHWNFGTFIK